MAVGIKTRLIGGEGFTRALSSLTPSQNRRITSDTLEAIAFRVQALSSLKIVRGRQSLPPLPSQLTFRKGKAVESIGVDLSGLPSRSETGSILLYPMLHEFGLGTPQRQWLEPAIDEVIPDEAQSLAVKFWERQARTTPCAAQGP